MMPILNDKVSKRFAANVLYLLAAAILMQDYAAVYAVAVVLMTAAAVLLVVSVVGAACGKANAGWLTALSEWAECLTIPGGLLLCACACYSHGSGSGGRLFLMLSLVSVVAELIGYLKRSK